MNKSDSIVELAKALVKAQAVMPSARETSNNPFFKSTYAPLEEIMGTIKKPLADNGLCISQLLTGEAAVETMLIHESGEWISSTLELKAVKQDPQSMGSVITYARRYMAAAIVGVVAEPDDDGNESNRPSAKSKATPASTSQAPPTQSEGAYTEKPTVNEAEREKTIQSGGVETKETLHQEIVDELTAQKKPVDHWLKTHYGPKTTASMKTVEELKELRDDLIKFKDVK